MASFEFQAGDYPERPGRYIMKDAAGRILYVGKSKNLRSRLRSYFQRRDQRKRIQQMVQEIASIEVVLVNNEAESLMLENNLIKIHKPPYNRALKRDNSGYAYLQMTSERLPRLEVFYRDRRSGADRPNAGPEPSGKEKRFGPYISGRFRDAVMEFVADHYRSAYLRHPAEAGMPLVPYRQMQRRLRRHDPGGGIPGDGAAGGRSADEPAGGPGRRDVRQDGILRGAARIREGG
ncbi:GIY-YIG nuclease family protein [Paenibacillus sp. P25]|nr:GIY-YIG nuclease family protein [Paenibacillus sp. P25]